MLPPCKVCSIPYRLSASWKETPSERPKSDEKDKGIFYEMSNKSPAKKKLPWIPPPARTHHPNKTSAKSQTESSSTAETNEISTDVKKVEGEFLDTASLSSISSSESIPCELTTHLHSIKREMKLLTINFMSIKNVSQFLVGVFSTYRIEDQTIKDLLTKTYEEVKEFIFNFDNLEYSVAFVENTISQEIKTEEYQKVVKLKENLLSKLLGCYSNIITIFQTLTHKQSSELLSKTQEDQNVLQRQLQEAEKKNISQNAVITDLERRLSIFQGKTNTMESYKITLEETRVELLKQLSYKDAQIKYLSAELSKFSGNQGVPESEKYLEIIEDLKKMAQAEKTALKKALKVQKLRAEKAEQLQEKLDKELKEKEKMLYDIAAQRDKLKLQLTIANNSIIEGKNQVEEIKHQNFKLQNEMCEKESNLKKQLQEMSESSNEKSAQLNDLLREKAKLEKNLLEVEGDLELTTKELNSLKSKYTDTNIFSKSHKDENYENALDVKQLISLLQTTQEYIKNIKSIPAESALAGGDRSMEENKIDHHKTLLKSVEEIKEHLLDLKNYQASNSKVSNSKSEMEIKLKELQQLYDRCSKENETLKTEVEELKNSRIHNSSMLPNESYPVSYIPENDFVKNLQVELRLKNEENWRLKQREKDLEHQLEEVRDKLQKKEAENFKLFSLEEELKLRKNEISLLEKKKEEESERLLIRTKELQKALDETTAECERLKRYVQDLRSSYLNVFGNS